jgi:excisionase family DNA binding protein
MNALAQRIAFNGVREAAEASGLRPHHIRQGIASGELRSHAVGRRTVILKDSLVEFIRRRDPPKSSRAHINEARASA